MHFPPRQFPLFTDKNMPFVYNPSAERDIRGFPVKNLELETDSIVQNTVNQQIFACY